MSLSKANSIAARIEDAVTQWNGVEVKPHRFGGVEFTVGRREIGHLHGSSLADIPFPVAIRRELVADGKADPHHVMPESGWISFRIHGDADVPAVLELLRLSYDRPWLVAKSATETRRPDED